MCRAKNETGLGCCFCWDRGEKMDLQEENLECQGTWCIVCKRDRISDVHVSIIVMIVDIFYILTTINGSPFAYVEAH